MNPAQILLVRASWPEAAARADTLGGAFTADVRDAWAAAYGAVAGIMRDAMAQGAREELAA